MQHEKLIELIDQQVVVGWGGVAWRHVAAGRAALSGEGARIAGGRWNPKGSFAVLYLGLSPDTVVAEFLRLARRQGLDPAAFLPRTLFSYDVEMHRLLDLRASSTRENLGLSSQDLASDDLTACRAIGEAAFVAGREGILAPSATGDGEILAIFLERLSAESSARDTDAQLWEEVPSLEDD